MRKISTITNPFKQIYDWNDAAGNDAHWSEYARGEAEYPIAFPRLTQAVNHCHEETKEMLVAYDTMRKYWTSLSEKAKLNSVAEVADAAVDLVYVATNVLYAMGLDPGEIFCNVDSANWEKLRGGVKRDTITGKILKPDGWQPPDHTRAILDAWETLRNGH